VSYDPGASDRLACASTLETGPGMILVFLPRGSSSLDAVGLSMTSVLPGQIGTGMSTAVSATLPDGSGPSAAGCQSDLLENTLLGSEKAGDRYLVRGTGSCTNQPASTLVVNGSFAFTGTTVWGK